MFLDNSGGDIQNYPLEGNTLQLCAWQIVDTLRRPQMDISNLMLFSKPMVKQYKADTMKKEIQSWLCYAELESKGYRQKRRNNPSWKLLLASLRHYLATTKILVMAILVQSHEEERIPDQFKLSATIILAWQGCGATSTRV